MAIEREREREREKEMAQSASSGLIDTGALTAGLQNLHTAEEVEGALTSVLMTAGIGTNAAAKYAGKLVEAAFDSSDALADLELDHLDKLGIPLGHQKLVLRSVFNGVLPVPATPGPVLSSPQQVPAAHAGAAPEHRLVEQSFRGEWPEPDGATGMMLASELRSFALALRGHLREAGKTTLAADLWQQVDRVGSDIRAGYVHADEDDAYLARLLVSCGKKGMPGPVSVICSTHVAADMGLKAWQSLCRRHFLSTEEAGKMLKARVRNPVPERNVVAVAARLTAWDADMAEALAKGYVFDQHDQRSALYGMVSKLEEFDSVVEALKLSVTGGYPSVETIRATLGARAADLEAQGQKLPKQQVTPAPGQGKSKKARQRAAKRAQAMAGAMENTTAPAWSDGQMRAMYTAMMKEKSGRDAETPCRDFQKGRCTYGERCRFKHEGASGAVCASVASTNRFAVLAASGKEGKKERFLAQMAALYEGEYNSVRQLTAAVRSVLQKTEGRSPIQTAPSEPSLERRRHLPAYVSKSGYGAWGRLLKAYRVQRAARRRAMPVADTGADANFLGDDLREEATNVRDVTPVSVDTANGVTCAKQRADVGESMFMRDSLVLEGSEESLCSVGYVCAKYDLGFRVDPGNVAACFYTKQGAEYWCVADGMRWRVPLETYKAAKAALPSWYKEHAIRGHGISLSM